MSENASIKITLDLAEAKARQRELDQGFEQSTNKAAGIGKAMFGGLSPIGAALASPLAAIGAGTIAKSGVGTVVDAFTDVASTALGEFFGTSGYVNRLKAAENAKDRTKSILGYAGAYASDQTIMSIYHTMRMFEDAVAKGATRIDELTNNQLGRRALAPVVPAMEKIVDQFH